MSLVYTNFLFRLFNLYFSGNDIRCALLMTNTTADTEDDAEFVGDFATLDEFDGAGYTRQALTGETVAQDDSNLRATFSFDLIDFGTPGSGTRSIAGILFYRFITNDAASPVICFYNESPFPFPANGGALTVEVDPMELFLRIRQGM